MIYKFTLLLGLLLFAGLNPLFADDPPIMNGNDTSPKYNISDNTPIAVLPDFTITGNTTIRGLRISFSAGHHNDQDNLYFTYQNGISGSFNKSAGVLTLTGNASTAAYQAAVRSITYKNDLGLSANRDQREFTISLENNDYLAVTGHFYEYVSTSVIWGDAISAAASRKYYGLQGYLCTISSYDENNIIYQKARGSYIWTSGTNDKISRWEWAAGPENGYGLSYTRWATGEPNNSGGREHFLAMSAASGYWNDVRGGELLGYVVEYGGMPGDPKFDMTTTTTLNMLFPPENLNYAGAPIVATYKTAIDAVTPTVTGTVDNFTISPSLPAGLSLDASTGKISGTPTVISSQTNYTVTASNAAGNTTATIQIAVDKKALTITAEDKSKEYDGAVYSPFTVSYSGFVSGEDKTDLGGTLAFSGTATTATNVGTGYVITPQGLTSSNYDISFVDGSLDITQKALTITAEDKSKEYDGAVYSPFTVSYSGFVSGEDKTDLGGTLAFSGTATTATNVGTGYVITPQGLTSSNYDITFVNGSLDITQKALTITAEDKSKEYDGAVYSPFTVSYSGFVSGEDKTDLGGTLAFSGTATTATNVGTGYVITPQGLTSSNYDISFVDGSLDITQKALTITAEDKSKEYDGAVYSPFTVSYSGFVSGEDKTDLGGTLAFSGTATTATNVGTGYVITPQGLTSSNYDITFVNGSLDITQKALTITAEDKSKEYDGAVYSPFTVSYSGFVSGEDKTDLGGTLAFSGTATTATNVGTGYVITPQGLTSSNYDISFVNGSLDITQKALTITAEDKSKEYDGAVYSPFMVSYSGFVSGEDKTDLGGTLAFSGTATTATNVGTGYVITPQGLTSSNYDISFVDGSLDITQKALTITAEDKSKEYDGAVYSPFTVSYSGFVSGEDKTDLGGTLAFSGTATTATNVGTGYVITPQGLTSSNYDITFVNGSLDITQKALTITAEDKSKEYDGAVYSPFTVSYSGFVSGEDKTDLGGTLAFSGTATTATNVGTGYVITPQGLTSSNYDISFVDGSLDITQKALTITAEDKSKEYDGAVYSPFTVSYSGFVSGEDKTDLGGTLAFSGTATTATNVGTGYVITPQGLTSSNYDISFVDGSLDITQKALTITAEDKSKEYDGAVYSPFTVSYSGFVSGEDKTDLGGTLAFSGTATTATNVGTGYVITPQGLTSSNYDITFVNGSLDITQKALTITAEDKSKEYDGAVYSPFTVSYSGFVSGEDKTDLGGTIAFSGTATTATNVGTGYVITPQGLTSSNYDISFVNGSLDITQKALTITAEDKSKEYDGAVYSPFMVSYSGFVSGEDKTDLGGTLAFSGTATTATNVGTGYVITPQGLTSSNYDISFVNGSLDITQKALTITAEDKSKEYDGAVYSPFTVSYSGFVSGENKTDLGGTLAFSGTATTATNVGTGYVITPQGLTSSNYDISFVDGSLDITNATQTITFDPLDAKVYGDAPFNLTGTSSSGLPVSYISSNRGVATVSGNTVTIVGAGTTNITASQAGNANYNTATQVSQLLTVNKYIAGDIDRDGIVTPPEVAGDTNGDGQIEDGEVAGDTDGDGTITSPEVAGDTNGDGQIGDGEVAGDTDGDGTITSPEVAGDTNGDGQIGDGEVAGDTDGDGTITSPEVAGDINGDGQIEDGEVAGDTDGDGTITSPEVAGDTDGDGQIEDGEVAGDTDGDGTITSPEVAGDTDGDGQIEDGEVAGDTDGDGTITSPEVAGDTNGDGQIEDGEVAGDTDGDGTVASPEVAGDTNGDGKIEDGEVAGDTDGDGTITSPEVAGDTNGDGQIEDGEVAGDTDGDGTITSPEVAGDTNGDGQIEDGEVAGDTDGDGTITSPEVAGDTNGDGKIEDGEVAGDTDGDGTITSPEVAGDTNGDGQIEDGEVAGDTDGDGTITSPEVAGDTNGDGQIEDGEVAGDTDGDGTVASPEVAGDTNGDGKIEDGEVVGDTDGDGQIDNGEVAGDTDGDGTITDPEISGDTDGDGQIDNGEVAGDTDGNGQIDNGEVAGDTNGDGTIIDPEVSGDTDGDGQIDDGEVAGDTDGNGQIDNGEVAGDTNGDGIITDSEVAGDTDGNGQINDGEVAGDIDGDGQIGDDEIAIWTVADISTLKINEEIFENPDDNVYYLIDCGDAFDHVSVSFELDSHATSSHLASFEISVPTPGIYSEDITVVSADSTNTRTYHVVIEKRFDEDIIVQKYNNVLLVNNNPGTNGGYHFTAFKWYKNSQLVGTGQYYSVGNEASDKLDPDARYFVEMETEDGDLLQSCELSVSFSVSFSLNVAPNPVKAGNIVHVATTYTPGMLEGMNITVKDIYGGTVMQTRARRNTSQITLPSSLAPGTYVVTTEAGGVVLSSKIIVQ